MSDLYSAIPKLRRPREDHVPGVQETKSVGRTRSRKKQSPDVDRKTSRLHNLHTFLRPVTFRGQLTSMINDSLKKFDDAGKETLMVLDHRQLEKPTLIQNALAL